MQRYKTISLKIRDKALIDFYREYERLDRKLKECVREILEKLTNTKITVIELSNGRVYAQGEGIIIVGRYCLLDGEIDVVVVKQVE